MLSINAKCVNIIDKPTIVERAILSLSKVTGIVRILCKMLTVNALFTRKLVEQLFHLIAVANTNFISCDAHGYINRIYLIYLKIYCQAKMFVWAVNCHAITQISLLIMFFKLLLCLKSSLDNIVDMLISGLKDKL